MSAQEILKTNSFKIAALVIGVMIIALVSFAGGMAVGFHKAKFSYKFGENYERNFIGRPFPGPMDMRRGPGSGDMVPDFMGRGFRNAHGIAGTIISVADNKIIIKDRDDQENTITVSDKTLIKLGPETVGINDLRNEDRIVVMGQPGDDGVVKADLIRIFDRTE